MALASVLLRNNFNYLVLSYIAPLRPLGSFVWLLLGLGTPRIFPVSPELIRDFFVGQIARSCYIFVVVSS